MLIYRESLTLLMFEYFASPASTPRSISTLTISIIGQSWGYREHLMSNPRCKPLLQWGQRPWWGLLEDMTI